MVTFATHVFGGRSTPVFLVAFLIVTAALPVSANIDRTTIARLEVESDGPVNPEATLEVLGLEIGGTLDRKLLRDAILSMYASTDAEWVKIESAGLPDPCRGRKSRPAQADRKMARRRARRRGVLDQHRGR